MFFQVLHLLLAVEYEQMLTSITAVRTNFNQDVALTSLHPTFCRRPNNRKATP